MALRAFFRGLVLAAALLFAACFLFGCVPQNGSLDDPPSGTQAGMVDSMMDSTPGPGAQIALVTTAARLESPFGQAVWDVISHFAGINGTTSGVYKAEADSADSAAAALELALRGGAELVFAMDETVSTAVAENAPDNSEISFALLDAPAGLSPVPNVAVLGFSAVQGGWLAGYTAVYESPEMLGIVPHEDETSAGYALGFALGADYAAAERGQAPGSLTLYWQDPTLRGRDGPALRTAQLLEAGASLVFAAVPAAQQAEVLELVQSAGGRFFGIGLELADAGTSALASLAFDAKPLVQQVLEGWHAGTFAGGTRLEGGVADGCITLKAEAGRFTEAREWILSQAPLRFEDGTLAPALEAAATGGEGGAPTPLDEVEYEVLTLASPLGES